MPLNLLKRGEKASAITAVEHDANFSAIESIVNATEADLNELAVTVASTLNPSDIAVGTITPAPAALNLGGGASGYVLTKQANGDWAAEILPTGSAAVTRVFDRTGVVIAQAGDYTVAQVTDAVATTRQIATTSSLTGGGDLSVNRTLSLVNDSASPGANQVYGTNSAGTKGWKSDVTMFANTSGSQAAQPSGGKWKMTAAITDVPVTNGWEGLYLNFTSSSLTLAPASGSCRVLETGATVANVIIANGKGVVVMGDGTNLIVMGDIQ